MSRVSILDSLLESLSESVSNKATALVIGIPGNYFARCLTNRINKIKRIDAVTENIIGECKGIISTPASNRTWQVVGKDSHDILYRGATKIGSYDGDVRSYLFSVKDIIDFSNSIVDLSLCYFSATNGHIDLLAHAIQGKAFSKAIIWLDCLDSDRVNFVARMQDIFPYTTYKLFTIVEGKVNSPNRHDSKVEVQSVIAVPTSRWMMPDDCEFLTALNRFPAKFFFSRNVNASTPAIGKLTKISSVLHNYRGNVKVFEPSYNGVYSEYSRSTLIGKETVMEVHAHTFEITFAVPFEGIFNVGIVVAAVPDSSTREALFARQDACDIHFSWRDDWWQFRSLWPLRFTNAGRAHTLRLRRPRTGQKLHIKGLEFDEVIQPQPDRPELLGAEGFIFT